MALPLTIETSFASQAIAWPNQEASSMIVFGHLYDAAIHDPHHPTCSLEQTLADMGESDMPKERAMEQETKLQADIPMQLKIPDRFAQVVAGIYRSSYPDAQNLSLFEVIGLRTIIRFVNGDYDEPVKQYLTRNGVRTSCIPVVPNKEGSLKTDDRTVNAILNILMDQNNRPVVLHCNQGKHRTGTMVGCFRKLQGWTYEAIVAEYRSFAGKKARVLDEAFIQAYKPGRGVRKTVLRLNVPSWTAAPDHLTESPSGDVKL